MKYFWTEQERKAHKTTCCFEFQRGKHKDECWKEDSLCLYADYFDDAQLSAIFTKAIKDFDYYGTTEVTQSRWEEIKTLAAAGGGEAAAIIAELTPWAEENFKTESVFTIIGI